MESLKGYGHPGFAASFPNTVGTVHLKNSDGWLLRRYIDNSDLTDLVSPDPVFVCSDFSAIASDLQALNPEATASLIIRTDAFCESHIVADIGGFDEISHFKTHYIAQLDQPWRSFTRRSCRRYADRAKSLFAIRLVEAPVTLASKLFTLNQTMVERHMLLPQLGYSNHMLATQLALPGARVFEVRDQAATIAIACFMEVGEYAYAYLLGCSNEARSRFAIYGLYGCALDYYQNRVRAIDFGGNSGLVDNGQDGLSLFKKGWSNTTKTSYLCKKILNHDLYKNLCRDHCASDPSFFPAYRAPEAPRTNKRDIPEDILHIDFPNLLD
jgi:hypothetical protein